MKLTEGYFEKLFDKKLANFATKDDLKALTTKDDLKLTISDQTAELKRYSDERTEELARMVADGFLAERDYLEEKFIELSEKLDIRDRVHVTKPRFPESRVN